MTLCRNSGCVRINQNVAVSIDIRNLPKRASTSLNTLEQLRLATVFNLNVATSMQQPGGTFSATTRRNHPLSINEKLSLEQAMI
ncbi:hypothetical protein OK016_06925 [Vibrio chagasii]|nr:hypothetical protein [Vibrio chagasii]